MLEISSFNYNPQLNFKSKHPQIGNLTRALGAAETRMKLLECANSDRFSNKYMNEITTRMTTLKTKARSIRHSKAQALAKLLNEAINSNDIAALYSAVDQVEECLILA